MGADPSGPNDKHKTQNDVLAVGRRKSVNPVQGSVARRPSAEMTNMPASGLDSVQVSTQPPRHNDAPYSAVVRQPVWNPSRLQMRRHAWVRTDSSCITLTLGRGSFRWGRRTYCGYRCRLASRRDADHPARSRKRLIHGSVVSVSRSRLGAVLCWKVTSECRWLAGRSGLPPSNRALPPPVRPAS